MRTSGAVILVYLSLVLVGAVRAQPVPGNPRQRISLNEHWFTVADSGNRKFEGFEKPAYSTKSWEQVSVPHNWDTYEGYRRMLHGNRHGSAWYRKTFISARPVAGKRYLLFFEGVSSYAHVWLNGKKVGYHAGGRTTFTLDVTPAIHAGSNLLAVRADHPPNIRDLPWVCGGCSDERGFSEGSQPMGIFRPVQLLVTDDVRIIPFGVHAWNDTTVSARSATISLETRVRNDGAGKGPISVSSVLLDRGGKPVASATTNIQPAPGRETLVAQAITLKGARLWSAEDPYLYTLVTELRAGGKLIDRERTPYGIRWISWPDAKNGNKRFRLNGKPVFINGVAEYEHLFGQSHAFSEQQIQTRVRMVEAAGFNSFRDGHQPHNLRYQAHWDKDGILLWTQLSAHIWFDTPEFRKNFKENLKEWVIERRNSPSVVLWGLQNESKLPADFARECTELIRSLDPTASTQRKVTTCNGGEGTDWDVPQNWTGTYGGDPKTYGEDLKRQVLVGEYGAWRTLGLHTEGGFVAGQPYSEDRMVQLMEQKIRLADSVRKEVAGHYFWLLTSHDNPGRVQGGEGYRELDRIGPVNYKGMFTPWEEPTDAFFLFRSNFVPKEKSPMVYIVSHTWPDRWITPGIKSGITVYSNCDEVELFNDVNASSLGKRKRGGIGTHFQWDKVDIRYNVLYAVGYVNGKAVVADQVILNHLPEAPALTRLRRPAGGDSLTRPRKGFFYKYRINCGGPSYRDENGNAWGPDDGNHAIPRYNGLPLFFGSQRVNSEPVAGTRDDKLFQSLVYGRQDLDYRFKVPKGESIVELYFAEPWLGRGGGMDCTGWRKFDVAINGKVVLKDFDIWKEAGYARAIKKTFVVTTDGLISITFPRVSSGQAVISAIAIGSRLKDEEIEFNSFSVKYSAGANLRFNFGQWLNTGDKPYRNSSITISALPPALYGANYLALDHLPDGRTLRYSIRSSGPGDLLLALDTLVRNVPDWLSAWERTGTTVQTDHDGGHLFNVYRKRLKFEEYAEVGEVPATPGADTYILAFPLPNHLQPAYDLKPVTNYKAIKGVRTGPTTKLETVNQREIVTLTGPGDGIGFSVNIGAADVYSLTTRYYSTSSRPINGRMELRAADGTLMHAEAILFQPGREGKWSYLPANTGTMINAGSYTVKFVLNEPGPVNIYDLDVQ